MQDGNTRDLTRLAAPWWASSSAAAHLNPPWGGHGYNTCIGDAVNIAWKIAAALRGWAGPQLLDSYEAERRPVAARTIAEAGAQEKALAHHFSTVEIGQDGPAAEEARRRTAEALAVKKSEFHSLGLVPGYAYTDSPVIVPDSSTPPAEARGVRAHRTPRSTTAARVAGRRPFALRRARPGIHPRGAGR
ncbi:FAD-dependent monooxygenase [Rhodococcus sp. WB9]|uniref:FAD-dependent monooxygenase n=1 Tax=Rhodococcus sp. WB9 TaxID=2594007 RepID=UPI0021B27804|nr:FAD-dependent monooxygenase [Rhodococcus sp. WB9]